MWARIIYRVMVNPISYWAELGLVFLAQNTNATNIDKDFKNPDVKCFQGLVGSLVGVIFNPASLEKLKQKCEFELAKALRMILRGRDTVSNLLSCREGAETSHRSGWEEKAVAILELQLIDSMCHRYQYYSSYLISGFDPFLQLESSFPRSPTASLVRREFED